MPVRFPSPVPPRTTQPVFVHPVPVLREAKAWNAVGAQWRASRLGLLSVQDLTVVVVVVLAVEEEKLKRRPKTE